MVGRRRESEAGGTSLTIELVFGWAIGGMWNFRMIGAVVT